MASDSGTTDSRSDHGDGPRHRYNAALAQEIGRTIAPRLVFGWPALREKLIAEAAKPQTYRWPGAKLKDGSVADY